MALVQAITDKTVFGNKRIVYGTYDCNGVTGGDIATGLARVEGFFMQSQGTAVEANSAVVNETLPLNGGDVTIVTDSGDTGFWLAIGR